MSLGPTTIDVRADRHGHAVDLACDQDRCSFREHADASWYRRPAIDHQLCVPGLFCVAIAAREVIRITVTQVAPRVRTRAFGLPLRLASRPKAVE